MGKDKNVLLGCFIYSHELIEFLKFLDSKFGIPKESVFVFDRKDDDFTLFITFKFKLKKGKKVNFNKLFSKKTIPIHKKGTAFYTINALNRLIEQNSELDVGNIDYKSVEIDWSHYQDTLILNEEEDLVFYDIEKVF